MSEFRARLKYRENDEIFDSQIFVYININRISIYDLENPGNFDYDEIGSERWIFS
jgi:hypothetical protein